jgi:predicted MarR family transcription regulator
MSESSKGLLSMLLVIGAQTPQRALRAKDLAQKLNGDLGLVEAELRKLIQSGYVATTGAPGDEGFYLTGTGVITASSTYS